MAEPISKKSGAHYRKTRARKNELEQAELSKIKPLTNFFKSSDNCEVLKKPLSVPSQSQPSTISETVSEIDSNNNLNESQNANSELQGPDTQIGITKKIF